MSKPFSTLVQELQFNCKKYLITRIMDTNKTVTLCGLFLCSLLKLLEIERRIKSTKEC